MNPEEIPEEIEAELQREIDGALNPDQVVRRDCAFCHYERSAKDDNHAPSCPYWVYFG